MFSGFNPKGTRPAYNYIRTLLNLDINKLYILDDQGERGSYYLGQDRRFDVEASVSSLITYIANNNSILHQNIICCGSSKGGYAALYYSIKYGFGHAIVGAPQTYLGSYLLSAKEYPTLKFIAGDSTEESVRFLNGLLFNLVEKALKLPNVIIHVGSGDHHYKDHVLPFVDILNDKGFNVNLDVKEYNDHGDVSFYQNLLLEKLKEIDLNLKNSFKINKLDFQVNGDNITLICEVNRDAQFAWYVFKDGERIETIWYSESNIFEYKINNSAIYQFTAFAKDKYGNILSLETDKFKV